MGNNNQGIKITITKIIIITKIMGNNNQNQGMVTITKIKLTIIEIE